MTSIYFVSCSSTSFYPKVYNGEQKKKQVMESAPPDKAILYITQKSNSGKCALYVNKEFVSNINGRYLVKVEVPQGRHKILCYFAGYASTNWFNKYYSTFKNIDIVVEAQKKYSVFYDWSYSKSHKMNRPFLVVKSDPDSVEKFISSRSLIIGQKNSVATNHIDYREKRLWDRTKAKGNLEMYRRFIATYPTSAYVKDAKQEIAIIEQQEDKDYEKYSKRNSFQGYYEYLDAYPNGKYHDSTIVKINQINGKLSNQQRLQNYQKLYLLNPKYIDSLEPNLKRQVKLLSVGPDDFNVGKIIKLKKGGLAEGLISAKIMATNERYENFNVDEIMTLNNMGLSNKIIESMIKVTANFDSQIKMVQQNKELMKQIQELIKNSQKNIPRSRSQSRSLSQTKSNQNNQDSNFSSCIKRKAALEACRNVGGFLRSTCELTAKSTYPCRQ